MQRDIKHHHYILRQHTESLPGSDIGYVTYSGHSHIVACMKLSEASFRVILLGWLAPMAHLSLECTSHTYCMQAEVSASITADNVRF
jgi:hypothetical protein